MTRLRHLKLECLIVDFRNLQNSVPCAQLFGNAPPKFFGYFNVHLYDAENFRM